MALWRDKPVRNHLVAIGRQRTTAATQSLKELEYIRVVSDYLASNVTAWLSPDTAKSWGKRTFLNHLIHKSEHPEPEEMIDSDILKGFWGAIGGQA